MGYLVVMIFAVVKAYSEARGRGSIRRKVYRPRSTKYRVSRGRYANGMSTGFLSMQWQAQNDDAMEDGLASFHVAFF